jgi:hypothetical protein
LKLFFEDVANRLLKVKKAANRVEDEAGFEYQSGCLSGM